jgi:hypothetical protein
MFFKKVRKGVQRTGESFRQNAPSCLFLNPFFALGTDVVVRSDGAILLPPGPCLPRGFA